MKTKTKVMAYITKNDKLLVFKQPAYPAAGIQVPAGTAEASEDLVSELFREIEEETGLTALKLTQKLGECRYDARQIGKSEIHYRHFYHLVVKEPMADQWQHVERYSGREAAIVFQFFWCTIQDAQRLLIADHGRYLSKLNQQNSTIAHCIQQPDFDSAQPSVK